MWFYSVRKTNELFDIGVNAHVQCTVASDLKSNPANGQLARGLAAAAKGDSVVADRTCTAAGRDFELVVLRQNGTLVSVALTRRGEQDSYPRSRTGMHEGTRQGYAVASFETGPWLAYVVSALPDRENDDLAERLAPAIRRAAGL
jgi:anti-sigma factor RsiW